MAGGYHPKIRLQPQNEANAEYDCALEWLESIAGSSGRFRNYQATFGRVSKRLSEGAADSIPAIVAPANFVETRFEAYGLVSIWRAFKSEMSPVLTKKLKIIVEGADLTSSEGQKTEPRDILFELETAALLRSWKLIVKLGSGADLSFKFQGVRVICECKRVQNPQGFDKRLQKAAGKLRKVLEDPRLPNNSFGIVVIDVSRIVHLNGQGTDLYQPTIYGEYILPSNMVIVRDWTEFQRTVERRVDCFAEEHSRSFRREFSPSVAGFMLCYNVLAVELEGTGRCRVLSYQRIGCFASATPTGCGFVQAFVRHAKSTYGSK